MVNKIYNVAELVKYLDAIRKYIITNPKCVETGKHGLKVFIDEIYEQVQDMCYEDLDPATDLAWPYTHYLQKYPEGTDGYILALYNAVKAIADNVLITEKGDCDYANHRSIEAYGYSVRKGSGDSFGWLSGRICSNDFEFYYG